MLKTRFESDTLLKQGGLLMPTGMPVSNMFRAAPSKRLITESPRFSHMRESVLMQPILEIVNNARPDPNIQKGATQHSLDDYEGYILNPTL
jgi:hypothetical protein